MAYLPICAPGVLKLTKSNAWAAHGSDTRAWGTPASARFASSVWADAIYGGNPISISTLAKRGSGRRLSMVGSTLSQMTAESRSSQALRSHSNA